MQIGTTMTTAWNEGRLPGEAPSHWYCVRTQLNREEIAFESLRRLGTVQIFLPRLKVKKAVNRKPVWRIEPLFPGYLFARFPFEEHHRAVIYANGVCSIVHFGPHHPTVDCAVIEELQQALGPDHTQEAVTALRLGEEVKVDAGPLEGFVGTVLRLQSNQMRVTLLLEMLGQKATVEVPVWDVRSVGGQRLTLNC